MSTDKGLLEKYQWTIGVKRCRDEFLFNFLFPEREQIVMAKESWEDEEDVADSWDAEEEEEEEEEVKVVVKPAPKASTTTTTAKTTTTPVAVKKVETEQEKKERLERAIKESDLENAMALFGISKDQINVDEVLEVNKKKGKLEFG